MFNKNIKRIDMDGYTLHSTQYTNIWNIKRVSPKLVNTWFSKSLVRYIVSKSLDSSEGSPGTKL